MAVFSLPLCCRYYSNGCAIASCVRVALRLAKPFLVYGAAPNHLILPSNVRCAACACVCVFVFVRLHASNVSNVRAHHFMMTIISASKIRIFLGPRKSESAQASRRGSPNLILNCIIFNTADRSGRREIWMAKFRATALAAIACAFDHQQAHHTHTQYTQSLMTHSSANYLLRSTGEKPVSLARLKTKQSAPMGFPCASMHFLRSVVGLLAKYNI